MSLKKLILILAFLCFVLAAFGLSTPINLIAVGLALWVLASLVE